MGSVYELSQRFEQLTKLAEEVGVDDCKWFVNGMRRLGASWSERIYQDLLRKCIDAYPGTYMHTDFPVPFKEEDLEEISGPYKLGTVARTDIEFSARDEHLSRHLLLAGDTGSGKSTAAGIFASQIIEKGVTKLVVIDPKGKGDFRWLCKRYKGVVVLRKPAIKVNPLSDIRNVPRTLLREALTEVTADAFFVLEPSEALLLKHFHKVLRKHAKPTWFDLVDSIRSEPKGGFRKHGYMDAIDTRLTFANISLGDALNCVDDSFQDLTDKHVVLEIDEFSDFGQRLLVAWYLMKYYLYSMKNQKSGLDRFFFFDDSQAQICTRNLYERKRTPFTAKVINQCRAFGMGLGILAQEPATKLLTEALANTHIKLCLQLGDAIEILRMSEHMGLNPEQVDRFYRLRKRQAICKLGYMEPTLLDIPDFPTESVSEDELREEMRLTWDELLAGVEPAISEQELSRLLEFEDTKAKSRTAESSKGPRTATTGTADAPPGDGVGDSEGLSDDEQAVLRVIRTQPFRLRGEVNSKLNDETVMGTQTISPTRSIKLKQELARKGYLESFRVPGTGRSGTAYCDMITEKAGMGSVYRPRGGNLHGFWIYRVCQSLKSNGHKPEMADTVGGKELDATAKIGDKLVGFEIVLSSFAVGNVRRNLDYVDELRVCCIDKKVQKKVTGQLKEFGEDIQRRTKVELLKHYFISLV